MMQEIRNSSLYIITVAVITTAGITFAVVDNLLMRDLREDLHREEKRVQELNTAMNKAKKAQKEAIADYNSDREKLTNRLEQLTAEKQQLSEKLKILELSSQATNAERILALQASETRLQTERRKAQEQAGLFEQRYKDCKSQKDAVVSELETCLSGDLTENDNQDPTREANSQTKVALPTGDCESPHARTDLTQCSDLSGIDFDNRSLAGADLSGVNLANSSFNGASLKGTILNGANLQGANLSQAQLSRADLTNATFDNARLWHTDLTEAVLRGATFRKADLYDAVFVGANLTGANLYSAEDIHTAKGLEKATVKDAIFNAGSLSATQLKALERTSAHLD